MRILVITNRFPRPAHPTHVIFNYLQVRALTKLHEVRTIVPIAWTDRLRDKTPTPAESEIDGMHIYYPTYWFTPKVLQNHCGSFFLRSIRGTVKQVLRDFTPDAVLAFWAHPDGWAAVKIAHELGVPALVKVMGSDVLVLRRNEGRRQRIADGLREADGVFAVSHDLAHHVSLLGVDSQKIHVVPEGTDTEVFHAGDQAVARARLGIPAAGRIVLFVGNLLFSKGAGLVIEACGILRDQGEEFTCYLVGGGGDATRLRNLAASLKLEKQVVFAGRCTQDRVADWYRASDVVTLPSYSEGSPNVLREAMCCGKPFVATRVGGIPEISSPAFSRLVDIGDVTQLARGLREMLAAPPRVDPSIPASYVITWDQSAAMIDRLLNELIVARKSIQQQERPLSAQIAGEF